MTPDGWRVLPIGKLLANETPGFWGSAPGGGGNVLVLRSTNLRDDGNLDYSEPAPRSFPETKLREKRLQAGDIVLERSGGGPNKPVGRVGYFDAEGWYSLSNFMQRLRPDPSRCSSRFLNYLLWNLHRSGITARMQQATTGIRNLNYREYLAYRVALPPLPEQRKIAAILSSVDDAIEKTQAVIDQVQVVKKGLMQELLTRGLPGRHKKFKQTEIGEVPEEWEVRELDGLVHLTGGNGFTPRDWSDHGLPIIRIQNLNGSRDFNLYAGPPDPRWIVEPGELLFAWAGSRGASFGPCLWPGPRGVLNQHIHRVIAKSGIDKGFLYYLLKHITAEVERRAHGFKQTLVHLRKGELTKWRVGLPGIDEQREIVSILDRVGERIDAERTWLVCLQGLKGSLLTDLLSGQIRVSPDSEVIADSSAGAGATA